MDILNADPQKLIDDAAKQVNPQAIPSNDPPLPPPTPPELPKTEEPPKLKEEAFLPPVVPTPAPDIPTPPPMPSAEPMQSTTFGAPAPKEPEPLPVSPPPSKKGGARKGVILAGLLLLLITLPVAVFYISQQQKQLTETRSKAAGASCGWCANQPQCPHAPEASKVGVCGGLDCCQGYNAGGSAPAPGGGGGGTTLLQNDKSSGCCSSTGQCTQWFGSVSTCSNPNGACASGMQCKGSSNCTPTHQCTNADCGVSNGCGQTCNGGCGGGGGGGGTTCTPGKIVCRKDNPNVCPNVTSSNPAYNQMVGRWCPSNGTIPTGNCPFDNTLQNGVPIGFNAYFYDACGSAQAQGGSCDGKVRLSAGGASHGGFIGCQGNLNCFCGAPNNSKPRGQTYTAADGNVNCFPDTDPNNPSCGASIVSAPAPTAAPSGCKSDWCTSASDCSSKGGTVGTPASFASCSPGLVACCVSLTQVTTPPPPAPGQCTRIKVYKGTVAVTPTTLVAGDNVTLAVAGTNATRGRIRVNGAAFVESTTLNANGEYTVPFTVPAGVPSFTIEAEVLTNGQWQ